MVTMSTLQIIYFLLFTILGICCYFQVKESVMKYLKGSTSEFTYERVEESLQMPVITVCPKTFKDAKIFETLMHFNVFSEEKIIWPESRYFTESNHLTDLNNTLKTGKMFLKSGVTIPIKLQISLVTLKS